MKKISKLKVIMTGANGKDSMGYTFRSDKTEDECFKAGLQYEFEFNTDTLNGMWDQELKDIGFDQEDIDELRKVPEYNPRKTWKPEEEEAC